MPSTTRTINRTPNSDTKTEWIPAADSDPAKVNADIASVMADDDVPEIEFPPGDIVILPGGLVVKDTVIREVQVKELTGEDEESLAKASQSASRFTFLDRLVNCGVERIGNQPAADNEKLLSSMLIGDREAILLGIREATYGSKIDVDGWLCPNCGVKDDLTLEISDIPVTKFTDAHEATFKVDLRKGGYATVRLATGANQLATFEKPDLTLAQYQSIILSKSIISVTNAAGIERFIASFPSMVLDLSIPDRHSVLEELTSRQPGPKYDKIKYKCHSCDENVNVAVTIGHLFLHFGWV
jgi:hypothetical protein